MTIPPSHSSSGVLDSDMFAQQVFTGSEKVLLLLLINYILSNQTRAI